MNSNGLPAFGIVLLSPGCNVYILIFVSKNLRPVIAEQVIAGKWWL
jgi:hypothetical protein